MSFYRRSYSWERIYEFASSCNFDSFNKCIINPDALILEDRISEDFIWVYRDLRDSERKILYECIENDTMFIRDLLKCIRVIKNPINKIVNQEHIIRYTALFNPKWKGLYREYLILNQLIK